MTRPNASADFDPSLAALLPTSGEDPHPGPLPAGEGTYTGFNPGYSFAVTVL